MRSVTKPFLGTIRMLTIENKSRPGSLECLTDAGVDLKIDKVDIFSLIYGEYHTQGCALQLIG